MSRGDERDRAGSTPSDRTSEAPCPTCGRPRDQHDRHLRFHLPEPVLDVPEAERKGRTWGNDTLMQVRDVGSFVRVMIPVKLTGGYTVTFGAWLWVSPDDLRHAHEIWWKPEYSGLRLSGRLANMLPGWEPATYLKPVEAAVLDPNKAPYVVASPDDFMQMVLTHEWPHEDLLAVVAPFEGSDQG